MPDLIHFSNSTLTLDNRSYEQVTQMKPAGLWYSVGGSWHEWCTDESFHIDYLSIETHLKIQYHKMLVLTSVEDIKDFTCQYSRNPFDWIDWLEVSRQYSGIEISPYQWGCRLTIGLSWYYGWDCASGCVWDMSILNQMPTSN